MYSHEIGQYIDKYNHRLNTVQLEVLMDTRLNPQISRIKYNDYSKEYEIWTTDNYYFKFNSVPYTDYINEVHNIVTQEEHKMQGTHYRLYASINGEPYMHIMTNSNILELFVPLDEFILNQEVPHSRYLIIEGSDQGDTPIYLGFGNKLDYLKFKKQQLEPLQNNEVQRLTK